MLVGVGTQLLMPRIYESDQESTIGSKARWHVSVLAPTMTVVALGLLNEELVRPAIASYRPGCDATNVGGAGCTTFGMPSTHTFLAFASLGQGAGILAVDTLKWSGGKLNAGAIAGDAAVPLIAAVLTYIGRTTGTPSYEDGGQALAGGGIGLATGLLAGIGYALLQRPECGYGEGIVCW
jgi:hypothetical protein